MVAKGLILIGLGVFAYFGLLSTTRVLERGIRSYLQKSLPGATVQVHVAADPFWIFSGNLRRVSLGMSHFDASQFPILTTSGEASAGGAETHTASRADVGVEPAFTGARGQTSGGEDLARTLVGSAYEVRPAEEPAPGAATVEELPTAAPPGSTRSDPESQLSAGPVDGQHRRTDEAPMGHSPDVVLAEGPGGNGPSAGAAPGESPSGGAVGGHGMIRAARIDEIDLNLSDFTYQDQHISRFHARIPEVEYDFGLARRKHLLKLGRSSPGTVEIGLSEADLNSAVTLDRPDVRDVHVYPEAGDLRVTLDYHTVLGWVPVAVNGQLSVVDGHVPPGKRCHPASGVDVPPVQRSIAERSTFRIGLHGSFP
ncbi:MAG: hypothetical protein LC772_04225, partial [Chloroflexi bacterium]|nr:hypothetical protein [Chloroflexota bacterium]